MKKTVLSLFAVSALLLSSCKDEGAPGSGGDGAVTLSMNFATGTKYAYDMNMDMDMEQSISGQKMNVGMDMIMESSYEVTSAEGDNKKISVTYDRMSMDMKSPMVSMKYDSKDTAGSNPMLAGMGAMVGKPFSMTVNRKGEILKVEGMDAILSEMSKGAGAQMSGQFNDSSIRGMMQQSMNIYPENPVKPGDTWNRSYTTNMAGMNVKNDNTYKLTKVSNGVADIDVEGKLSLHGAPEAKMQGMKMQINGTQKGTLHVEVATGLIKDADFKQDIKGEVAAAGTTIPMNMKSDIRIKGRKK